MKNTLFTCSICKDIFRNHSDLKNHVRRDHQSSVKIKFQNGDVVEIKRAEDNTFKCRCERRFKLPTSLHRHAKNCHNRLPEPEEDEEEGELMDVDDSDASGSLNGDSRVVLTDCFGTRISHEEANCRG